MLTDYGSYYESSKDFLFLDFWGGNVIMIGWNQLSFLSLHIPQQILLPLYDFVSEHISILVSWQRADLGHGHRSFVQSINKNLLIIH